MKYEAVPFIMHKYTANVYEYSIFLLIAKVHIKDRLCAPLFFAEGEEKQTMKINPKYLSFYYQNMTEIPDIRLDPAKTALLIIDMQNEFVLRDFGEAARFKAEGDWERWIPFHDRLDNVTIPACRKLLDYFRKTGMYVTYGRIASLREDGADRSMVQKSEGWNGMLLPVNSKNAAIIDELKPEKDEIVVNKTTDSVLAGTNYARLLRNMGVDTVVVCGIVTDQCVAGTVRELADNDFHVITVEDGCAAADQELHDAELKIMNIIYCNVLSSDETIEVLEQNRQRVAKEKADAAR